MMFVEHHAVEIHQFGVGINLLVEILIEQFRPMLALKEAIGRVVETAQSNDLIFERMILRRVNLGIVMVRPFR
jgi:hypothetical protein